MLRSSSLTVIFIVLTAAILSAARAGVGDPVSGTCRARPSGLAPPGSHWFYRLNRTDNRHCWYLGSAGLRAHLRAPEAAVHPASENPTPQADEAAGTSLATSLATNLATNLATSAKSTPAAVTAPRAHSRAPEATARLASANQPPRPNATAGASTRIPAQTTQTAAPAQTASVPFPELSNQFPPLVFAARWSDLPKSQEVDAAVLVASGSSAGDSGPAADAAEPTLATRPERSNPLLESATAAAAPILAAIGLVLASMIIAGAAFVRRPFHQLAAWLRLVRDPSDDFARPRATGSAAQTAGGRSPPLPVPTDPARDVRTSLRELMDDLRRADAADRSRSARRAPGSEPPNRPSKATAPASQTTPLLRSGDRNQSIWRASNKPSDTLVSEAS